MSHDDIDGVWDPETKRYYYPEYTPDTQAMPSFWSDKVPWNNAHTTFTGRHGEKVTYSPKQREKVEQRKPIDPFPESAMRIARECDRIKATLLEKHMQYGRSATDPVRIFSDCPADEQLRVRIDDKLSRIVRGDGSGDEDAIFDLIGYLILLRIVNRG